MLLAQPSTKCYLLAVLILILITKVNCINRCRIDHAYSFRICNAIRDYISQLSPCEPDEIEILQRRILSLRRTLRELQAQEERLREIVAEPRTACKGGRFGNKCYFLLDESGLRDTKTYSQAESACRAQQASLVSIDSKRVYDFVYDFILTRSKDFTQRARNLVIGWTGSSYRNGQIYLPDNSTSTFVQWSMFHPTNYTGRNKVGIAVSANPHGGGMFNAVPITRLYPICEKSTST